MTGAVQAASGMMNVNGHPETGPTRAGFFVVDMSTGLTAAMAIAAALYRRLATGEGQHLDVAMMDAALTIQTTRLVSHTVDGEEAVLEGNASATGQPTANVFPTADGHLQISVIQQAQVERLFGAMEISHLLDDPRFADSDARIANNRALYEILLDAFAGDSTANWVERLSAVRVPVGAVNRYADVVADPQMAYRDVLVEVDGPPSLGGCQKLVGAGYKANADGPQVRFPAPDLGQHTDEILREIGYSKKRNRRPT